MTVTIRVVRPPRDKSRSVPVWPVGSSGTVSSRGGHHTPSPDENIAKLRIGSRLSPSVSGGNDAHDTRVDRAANRGHRPRALRLCLSRRSANSIITTTNSILTYDTAGSIDTSSASDGVTGSNMISFVPITSASVDANSNFSVGYFQVTGQAAGQSTTYDNTPFSITYSPASIDGNAVTGTAVISGVLNGTVTGGDYSTVVATFKNVSNSSFSTVDNGNLVTSVLSIPQGSQLLVPSTTFNGETTVEGLVTTSGVPVQETAAPEPSTIALFLSTVCGLGLRKYVLARRQRCEA